MGMAVQRGKAASIIGTLGPQRKLDGYIDIIITRMSRKYVSHVLPESKSVAILVVNERPPCTPISVCFNKVGLLKEIVLIFEKKIYL